MCEIVGGLGFVRILFIFNIWQYSLIFRGILGLKMDVCGLCFTVAVVYVQIKLRALAFSSAIAPHGGRHSECARNGEAGDSPRVFSGRLAETKKARVVAMPIDQREMGWATVSN